MAHDASTDSAVFAHSYRAADEQHEALKLACRLYGYAYLSGDGSRPVAAFGP
jgi:hypothetical protein